MGTLIGATKTQAIRRMCIECGKIAAPGPLGTHQRWKNHLGWIDLPTTNKE